MNINKKIIFPDIDIKEAVIIKEHSSSIHVIKIETTIRIKHKDKYYLTKVLTTHQEPTTTPEIYNEAKNIVVKRFTAEVYRAQQLMIVSDIVAPDNFGDLHKLFELDPDQTVEKERLRKMLNFK